MSAAASAATRKIAIEAGYSARFAIRDNEVMNRAMDRGPDFVSESTQRRFASAAEKIVESLLMVDEYALQTRADTEVRNAAVLSGRHRGQPAAQRQHP